MTLTDRSLQPGELSHYRIGCVWRTGCFALSKCGKLQTLGCKGGKVALAKRGGQCTVRMQRKQTTHRARAKASNRVGSGAGVGGQGWLPWTQLPHFSLGILLSQTSRRPSHCRPVSSPTPRRGLQWLREVAPGIPGNEKGGVHSPERVMECEAFGSSRLNMTWVLESYEITRKVDPSKAFVFAKKRINHKGK